jgi:hypothetical protein
MKMSDQTQTAYVEHGTQGAFRATWRKVQPRLLLERLVNENPDANEEKIHLMFWQEIEEDKDYLRACVEYWLDNNYASILRPKSKEAFERNHSVKRDEVKKKIKQRVQQEVYVALLELEMPNGKPLGDCTGRDCKKFNNWFATLAGKVPANKLVRDVLSENEIYKVWQASKRK